MSNFFAQFFSSGWGFVQTLATFLIVLTVLVFVHELGHYLVARRNRVRVETFSIGFGPELFGWWDKAGTRWKFSAIPLGGYVKMFGDSDAASMPSAGLPKMTEAEKAVSFHHKRLGQRTAVVAAGPAANFIFAILLFAVLYMTVGQPYTSPEVGAVLPASAAEQGGMKAGDVIVRIDGRAIDRFELVQQIIQINQGTPVEIVVRRDGAEVPLTVTPQIVEEKDIFGNLHRHGKIGVRGGTPEYVKRDPVTAIYQAFGETWNLSVGTLQAMGQMIIGARGTEELGGPIGIAKMSGEVARLGPTALIGFMAVLSVNLGLINLFPIPVLDGGHLLFYAAEAVRGRPLGQKAQEYGFRIGLALVLMLMVFATWNDLEKMPFFATLKNWLT
jgi:regulator of sigma E protease